MCVWLRSELGCAIHGTSHEVPGLPRVTTAVPQLASSDHLGVGMVAAK